MVGMKSAKILKIKFKKLFSNSTVTVLRKHPDELENFLIEQNEDKKIALFMDKGQGSYDGKEQKQCPV